MENREIEVRFLNIDKERLIKKLIEYGATDKGDTLLREIIFYDSGLSWLNEGRFIRLRSDSKNTKLTYKQNKEQTIDSAYEVELSVPDIEQTKKFLEGIGFRAYRHQEKKRHTLVADSVVIDIDTWPHIPTYVEFEGPSQEKLKSFVQSIGFDWSQAVFADARAIIEQHYRIPLGKLRWFTFDQCK